MTPKTLIMLVGPQGSGKTYHCERSLNTVTPEKARQDRCVRISQDDQGKTAHFEKFLALVEKSHPIVVDRINHTVEQRNRYIEPARKKGYQIKFVWFDVDRQTCAARLAHRTNHPTIKKTDNHDRILGGYFSAFEKPHESEYDEITIITKRKHANVLDLRKVIGDKKYIVVGDIHGCWDEFQALLKKCEYEEGDFLISVGDLTDRGPKPREVLEWFYIRENVYVVEGNHDNKLRRYLRGRKVKINNGLESTIGQLEGLDKTIYADWIESWPQIIQVPDVGNKPTYIVHAGVDGNHPIDRQPVENCLYARYFGGEGFLDESGKIWYESLDGSCCIMSGHMIHENATVDGKPVALLDGGAFQGGELRAAVVDVLDINSVGSATIGLNFRYWELVTVPSKEYSIPNKPINGVYQRDEFVDQQLLRCDDRDDMRVYTYTDNCSQSSAWNNITLNSRGIILNRKTGEVVAQPFSKFFNMGERVETMEKNLPWNLHYLVFEKLDGWLGTLYRHNGKHCIATRGSFDGDGMGTWATKRLDANHDLTGLPDDVTLVFELICPHTHIIVNYGDKEDLVLTAAFNRHTGDEYSWDKVVAWAKEFKFTLPRVYSSDDFSKLQNALLSRSGSEAEGFVIRFSSGLRVKIKSEDYRRRAAILSNLTPLSIWKAMKDGRVDPEYAKMINADYIDQYNALVKTLRDEYDRVLDEINQDYAKLNPKLPRKEFALSFKGLDLKHPYCMFSVLDGKSLDDNIMKNIRPSSNIISQKEN